MVTSMSAKKASRMAFKADLKAGLYVVYTRHIGLRKKVFVIHNSRVIPF